MARRELTFMDWAPGDFYSSPRVRSLSMLGRMMYRELLDLSWQAQGAGLPDDIEALSVTLGVHAAYASWSGRGLAVYRAWLRRGLEEAMSMFEKRDGRLYNRRIEEDLQKALMKREKASRDGKRGAKLRWGPHAHVDSSHPIPSDVLISDHPSDDLRFEHSSTRVDAISTGRLEEIGVAWNELAAKESLPAIRLPLTEGRRRKLRARLRETPDFFEQAAAAIRSRGRWARDQGFPGFDQILQASTAQKLLEGFYAPKPAETGRGASDPEPGYSRPAAVPERLSDEELRARQEAAEAARKAFLAARRSQNGE